MLPNGWQTASVRSVCTQVSVGIVVNPSHFYVPDGKGVRAFRSGNVRENAVQDDKWAYLSEEGHRKNSKSKLRAGDVLVVRTGFAGTACVVPKELDGCNCIDILFARPDPGKVVPEYLAQLTNSEQGRRQVFSGQSGLAQKHLNVSSYSKMTFALPPVQEQRRIVEILSTWDQAIATTERLLGNCEEQKLGLMQGLLTGKLRLNGYGEGWKEHLLGKLFTERVESNRDDLPLLSITREQGVILRDDVGRKDTSNEDKSKYLRICPGDIGYNTMRMWQGVSALSQYEGIVSPAYTVITPGALIDGRFASYLFKLQAVVFLFYRHSQGLVSDTWNLKFSHFSKIKIKIPSIQEQRSIAEVLEKADQKIEVIQRQLSALSEEKAALMSQLLTGKRRVKMTEMETEAQA